MNLALKRFLRLGAAALIFFLHAVLVSAQTAPPPQAPAQALTLADLESMALSSNPTLVQAAAEIRAAEGRKLQSGLYPNPTVGYSGEEIRGATQRGGQQGFFVQQDIVLGNKLGLNRQIFEQERQQAQTEAEEQRLRVLTGVRLYFVRALAAQETVRVRRQLSQLADNAVNTSNQLFNVGQADQPDLLSAEIEAQQVQLALVAAEQNQLSVWKGLTATAGRPDVPLTPLEGNLEEFGSLDSEWLTNMLQQSPAVKIAELSVNRAQAVLARARREPIPDLQLRAGLQQNRELLDLSGRPIGLQGFAEAGVQIPLFNRNQGNVAAANAQIERAQREVERVRLVLRDRAAAIFQNYQTARDAAERYKSQMIPRAQRAYDLYLARYQGMAAAYPQVLIAQRTLFQIQDAYVTALESLGTSALALKSFLLTDGLEAPARPGEGIDEPVREINLPRGMPWFTPGK